jgi:metal-responsive CopG/Arc/MetJ family transcriptional regulator
MATKQKAVTLAHPTTTRISVSFPSDLYQTIEKIAQSQKVSVAWIVRDAAEKYVSARWPLLAKES